MNKPLVSICLSVYNAEKYIGEAIRSILSQSYENFELFIIDDCSTDSTRQKILSYTDDRVKFIEHVSNKGLAQSRQEVIDQAKGEYLFWMDADDISHPERIAQQVAALESNPDMIICGTNAVIISEKGETVGSTNQPLDDAAIKAGLFFGFPFTSPTVAIRLQCLRNNKFRWSPEIRVSEDYILYSSLFGNGSFANLRSPLYYYRVHEQPNRITSFRNSEAIIHGRKIAWRNLLQHWKLNASDEVLHLHDKLTYYTQLITNADIQQADKYLMLLSQILSGNKQLQVVDQNLLHRHVNSFAYMLLMHPLLPLKDAWHLLGKYDVVWSWLSKSKIYLKKMVKATRQVYNKI